MSDNDIEKQLRDAAKGDPESEEAVELALADGFAYVIGRLDNRLQRLCEVAIQSCLLSDEPVTIPELLYTGVCEATFDFWKAVRDINEQVAETALDKLIEETKEE